MKFIKRIGWTPQPPQGGAIWLGLSQTFSVVLCASLCSSVTVIKFLFVYFAPFSPTEALAKGDFVHFAVKKNN